VSTHRTPLGFGLYFIDVLACTLFSITLALVGARFDREERVSVQLPAIERSRRAADAAPELVAQSVTLREEPSGMRIYLGEEPISLAALTARLQAAPPPSLVVRSEQSMLAQVIALAHTAGVHDVQVAYEPASEGRP
jgi:hypothetical protein